MWGSSEAVLGSTIETCMGLKRVVLGILYTVWGFPRGCCFLNFILQTCLLCGRDAVIILDVVNAFGRPQTEEFHRLFFVLFELEWGAVFDQEDELPLFHIRRHRVNWNNSNNWNKMRVYECFHRIAWSTTFILFNSSAYIKKLITTYAFRTIMLKGAGRSQHLSLFSRVIIVLIPWFPYRSEYHILITCHQNAFLPVD